MRIHEATFLWAAQTQAHAEQDTAANAKGPRHSQAEKPLENDVFSLQDISIDILRGHLVAVVGRVGSGKSSLLQAVSGNASLGR